MRFPWSQVIKAVLGMAALIVILERAGGFSLILERGSGAFGTAFSSLTPAPRGQAAATRRLRPSRQVPRTFRA